VDLDSRRTKLRQLFDMAVAAVEPEKLVRESLTDLTEAPATLIAIGKASPAMCRGAARILDEVRGVCVAIGPDEVPEGIELLVGDHPIPEEGSFRAGRRVLEIAATAPDRIIALISGGGSALCEHPIAGVSPEFVCEANKTLVSSGAPITEMNLVRRHLSAIKGGGLLHAAKTPIDTYLISDVCGADPSVIASGPTMPSAADPEGAISAMVDHGIVVPPSVKEAIRGAPRPEARAGAIQVIADGRNAADAAAASARSSGLQASVLDGWLSGPISSAFDEFITHAGPGITIATGEPDIAVSGDGRGGRNTHAALLAAERLTGTGRVFAAFATDGVDGNSSSAGAIVDGDTVSRGGDPRPALDRYDSARYLRATGDLVETGPTGTNVSDLWILWQ
jgi:glycerate 2-kinase